MWPIQETAAHIVAKSYPIQQAVGMCRYVSLLNINPSGITCIAQSVRVQCVFSEEVIFQNKLFCSSIH